MNRIKIPSIDYLLNNIRIDGLTDHEILKKLIKEFVESYKKNKGIETDSKESFLAVTAEYIESAIKNPFKPVINGSGIILHTNLGRAPLSQEVYEKSKVQICNYTNLEFDLNSGIRGDRNDHLKGIIRLLTGAEDAIIVNNNAAAVWLVLNEFTKAKEVIVSRSELIEIGGSFRIPDIMEASGSILKEVGTTNCCRLSDYKKNINDNTAMIFKAHQSNYYIGGHTEEADLQDLCLLAKENNLISYYDMGSGLLKKSNLLSQCKEHTVKEVIEIGVDLISFSADKLIGGPQAGIIAGRKDFIKRLSKNPLMRVLRVDKITLSILYNCLEMYLDESRLEKHNPVYKYLNRDLKYLNKLGKKLSRLFNANSIKTKIVNSEARTGGGTLPAFVIDSLALEFICDKLLAEKLYFFLLNSENPIVCILKEGTLYLDLLCINEKDSDLIIKKITEGFKRCAI
jgi:L-seryl-tRNA(Ser) seleniumtransferase